MLSPQKGGGGVLEHEELAVPGCNLESRANHWESVDPESECLGNHRRRKQNSALQD